MNKLKAFKNFVINHMLPISICTGIGLIAVIAIYLAYHSKQSRLVITPTSLVPNSTSSSTDNATVSTESGSGDQYLVTSTDENGNTVVIYQPREDDSTNNTTTSPKPSTSTASKSNSAPSVVTSKPAVVDPAPTPSVPSEVTASSKPSTTSTASKTSNSNDPFSYPYDIDAITAYCKEVTLDLGMRWIDEWNLDNSDWTTPNSTVPFTRGTNDTLDEWLKKNLTEARDIGCTLMKVLFIPHPTIDGDYYIYFCAA